MLAGKRAYVDLAGAENASAASMRTLARTAQAIGAAIGDMATVSYSLQNALKVRPDDMENVIGGLINQSKDGTIHFQNMAEEIIALAPKFARFGTLGREGATELARLRSGLSRPRRQSHDTFHLEQYRDSLRRFQRRSVIAGLLSSLGIDPWIDLLAIDPRHSVTKPANRSKPHRRSIGSSATYTSMPCGITVPSDQARRGSSSASRGPCPMPP